MRWTLRLVHLQIPQLFGEVFHARIKLCLSFIYIFLMFLCPCPTFDNIAFEFLEVERFFTIFMVRDSFVSPRVTFFQHLFHNFFRRELFINFRLLNISCLLFVFNATRGARVKFHNRWIIHMRRLFVLKRVLIILNSETNLQSSQIKSSVKGVESLSFEI